MTRIELIFDRDCPNVSKARANLLQAFAEAKQPARWVEWDQSDPESPPYVRSYGSPTVLVDGEDVAGAEPSDNVSCCRLYASPSGEMQGMPSVAAIVSAMQSAAGVISEEAPLKTGWRSSLAVLPGVGVTLLPVGLCPACWPAYAGALSAVGAGVLLKAAYLLPVTALFLFIAVGAMVFRARTRRGYGPFIVGLAASAIVLIGKFVFVSDMAMYGGIILLMAASVWNAWPRRAVDAGSGACPACAPEGQALHSR